MHPVLSWGILLVTICIGYVAFRGVPQTLLQSNTQESHDAGRAQKRKKRQTRASQTNPEAEAASLRKESMDNVRKRAADGQNHTKASTRHPTSNKVGETSISTNRATNAKSNGNVSHGFQKESVDPLEDVMNGRPRKTSTPIGVRASKLASPSSNEVSEEEEHGEMLPYTVSKQKYRAHVTDDMLPAENRTTARTLKIRPASEHNGNTHPTQRKNPKSEEQMTKKQRQNAAKKLKAKAEKAEVDQRQAAALRSHQRTLEAQKIAQLTDRTSSIVPSERNNVWTSQADNWQTVSKNKKNANEIAQSRTSTDALIWDV